MRTILTPLVFVLFAAVSANSLHAQGKPSTVSPVAQATTSSLAGTDQSRLERERFDYLKHLEDQKLEVERLKAWLTGGSILLPLGLGVLTLYWQSRNANKLKDRETKDAFDIKAAEILFMTDSTTGTKNRAKALSVLFPGRFPEQFGEAFQPTQFGGPKFEAKLEVFKAACTKITTPAEVYEIWHAIFPGDKWIEPLLPGSKSADPGVNANAA